MATNYGYIKTIDLDEFNDTDLNITEFILFNYIRGFKQGCFATKTSISKVFKIQRKTLNRYLEKLSDEGFIEEKTVDGRQVYLSKTTRQAGQMTQSMSKLTYQSGQNDTTNNDMDNNKYNNSYIARAKKNKTNASYDKDEFMRRALNDPLIYKSRDKK